MSEPETRHAPDTPSPPAAPWADGPVVPRPLSRPDAPAVPNAVSVIGRGRAGTALAGAFQAAGVEVNGPLAREEQPRTDVVLLCVPDTEIGPAAEVLASATPRFVGHVSGATPLAVLAPIHRAGGEVFGLHPLQTFSDRGEASLTGVGCAIAGSSPSAVALARALAERLGMSPFEIDDERRAGYHAAASIASNFLVTLQAAAEAVAAGAGFAPEDARSLLVPLVRQTVENWVAEGPETALTGPVARGDGQTVARQREAVAAAEPELLPLFDALVERTAAVAARTAAGPRTASTPLEVAA